MFNKKFSFLIGTIIILIIIVTYIPALNIYLRGDDFEWLNSIYSCWEQPLSLFSTINNFFRPMVKLSYLLNYTLFGTNTPFYAATTILIHLGNVLLLYILILRITRRIIPASIISLVFGISPLYSEITLWSAARPDSIMLLFILSSLIIVARPGKQLKKRAFFLLFTFGLGAACSKETWIILPFVLISFLILIKKYPIKRAIKTSYVIIFLLILYLVFFIIVPIISNAPSPTNYPNYDINYGLKKAGYLVFKYTGFGNLYTGETWQILLAFISFTGFGFLLFCQKNRLAFWGMTFMILSMLPTILIKYAPSRYNYLPLVGFYIMVIAFFEKGIEWLSKKYKIKEIYISIIIITTLVFYLSFQVIMLQWEIKDYKYFGNSHKQVVDMYNKIKDKLPLDQPIFFINAGTKKAVYEASQSVQGYSKLLFARNKGIWQMVYLAPLANFAGQPFKYLMDPIPKEEMGSVIKGVFIVLLFKDNGFSFTEKYSKKLKEFYKRYHSLPDQVQALWFVNIKRE
jgi:hypothetical protein